LTRGWKFGDPMRERADKVIERVGGQRTVDPAVPFGQPLVILTS
jgi:hypothetical protein